MSVNRSTILGLFFLVTLSVLAYYTLFLTDFTLFKKQSELRVHFEQANGLREGDAVLVAGMRWGRVKKLTFDPKAPVAERITVLAVLNEPLELHEGFKIQIRDATLLGGRNLSIDPGPGEGGVVSTDKVLDGSVAPNPIDALTKIVDSSGKGIEEIVENVRVVTADMRAGKGLFGRLTRDEAMGDDLAAAMSSAKQTLADVALLTKDLRAGRGTAGQLLADDTLYVQLTAVTTKLMGMLDEVSALATEVRRGNGIAGRLIQDETLANNVAETTATVAAILRKIDTGQGTVGILINEPQIARNVEAITKSVAEGEGTIGALLTSPAIYDNIRQFTEDLAVVSSALRSGQGSFGRLVMDDDMYQDLKTAIRIVQRSLEEFREAAPITNFTSVFFGAF